MSDIRSKRAKSIFNNIKYEKNSAATQTKLKVTLRYVGKSNQRVQQPTFSLLSFARAAISKATSQSRAAHPAFVDCELGAATKMKGLVTPTSTWSKLRASRTTLFLD